MAFGNGPRIVTDGLVLSIDAADKNCYSGTGTIWYDLSGNNYSGSLINGTSFINSNGGVFSFDGVDDYLSLPNMNHSTSSNITIEILMKITETSIRTPTAGQTNAFIASSSGRQDAYYQRPINVNGSIPEVAFFSAAYGSVGIYDSYFRILDNSLNNYPTIFQDNYNTNGTLTAASTIQPKLLPDNYFHYVWIINNTAGSRSCTHYLNTNSISVTGGAPTSDFSFFQKNNLRLSGKNHISFFKIYNRTLTLSEVRVNYNALKSRFGL
jgi:hypothetical protein